jgi:hypothetical protein
MQSTDELSVTLQASQWDAVLHLLNEVPAPRRVTNALFLSIERQCMRQDTAVSPRREFPLPPMAPEGYGSSNERRVPRAVPEDQSA